MDRSLVKAATCPIACTPLSVREAPMSVTGSRRISRTASSSTPCAVRSGGSPGGCCFCQPLKSVPS